MSYITYVECTTGTRQIMPSSMCYLSCDPKKISECVDKAIEFHNTVSKFRDECLDKSDDETMSDARIALMRKAQAVLLGRPFHDGGEFIRNVREFTTLEEAMNYSKGSTCP